MLAVPSRIAALDRETRAPLAAIQALGLPLAPPLRLRDGHDRAYREGLPVSLAAPGSPEHREVAAIARVVVEALDLAARPGATRAMPPRMAGAGPVRAAYLDEPPGARGPLDLGAYRRRLRDRFLPVLFGRR